MVGIMVILTQKTNSKQSWFAVLTNCFNRLPMPVIEQLQGEAFPWGCRQVPGFSNRPMGRVSIPALQPGPHRLQDPLPIPFAQLFKQMHCLFDFGIGRWSGRQQSRPAKNLFRRDFKSISDGSANIRTGITCPIKNVIDGPCSYFCFIGQIRRFQPSSFQLSFQPLAKFFHQKTFYFQYIFLRKDNIFQTCLSLSTRVTIFRTCLKKGLLTLPTPPSPAK